MERSPKDIALATCQLYKLCEASKWLEEPECFNSAVLGVAIRGPVQDDYTFEPTTMELQVMMAIRSLDMPVAFTMASGITSAVFTQVSPYQTELLIQPRGTRIPVVDSFKHVPARSFEIRQSLACLVKQENIVLLLANTIEGASPHGSYVEHLLIESVWGSSVGMPRALSRSVSYLMDLHGMQTSSLARSGSKTISTDFSGRQSMMTLNGLIEKEDTIPQGTMKAQSGEEEIVDPEVARKGPAKRPMILTHSVMVGITLIILITLESLVISKVIAECKYDGRYSRIAYLAVVPIFAGFAFCSALLVIFSIFQIFCPIGDNLGNSRFYSAVAPDPARFGEVELPHITIQVPVFMEGLTGVIAPTIASIKATVKHYEGVGGTASIFINDDGMQVIHPDLAQARRRFYAANHIGWCARPPHGQDEFLRRGRFKKASNMNYCLDFSNRVEDELLRLMARQEEITKTRDITLEQENELYRQALDATIIADQGRTLAAGNVRIGEIILLVDCDTRVPENCLYMGALEMIECPNIAIIQHSSGVLKVAYNMFETGISYLTDLVYTAVAFNVGSGDCPCFVGHNAFLRWKTVQSVIFEEGGIAKFWSEEHVSEDFHLSLRLQIAGFELRMASYHKGDFKEGVSLTVFDELARWEKYAYGINELVFNPIWKWYKGPITPLYLSYFMSNIKSSSKLMVLSYTFTYYAIAVGLPLTLVNYLLVGWFPSTLDQFYVSSWRVIVVTLVIFDIISPISYCIVRYRLGQERLRDSIIQTVTWTPLIVLFFGGISFHLSKALIWHFLGGQMEWTATAKELESTGFFIGMDKIVKDFKYMYITLLLIIGVMIYLGIYAPYGWLITDWTAIVPLAFQVVCHFFVPIVLGLF